jgi:ribose-phosphate pyrophosphokinase
MYYTLGGRKFMECMLFSGRANRAFAEALGRELKHVAFECDVPVIAKQFNDGEPDVQLATNVRGTDTFIIQPTHPPADHLFELLAMIDAAMRASAQSITAVMPYFGCARQDRKVRPRVPITAALVAKLLKSAGAHRVLTTDLHAGQVQGFFDGPFDNLESLPVLLRAIRKESDLDFKEIALVSPDDGGLERCRETGKLIGSRRATFVVKYRDDDRKAHTYGVRDSDIVEGRDCLLIDDMVCSAGTLVAGARALEEAGARRIIAAAVHPVLSTDQRTGETAMERIMQSPIERIYMSDTIPISTQKLATADFEDKLRVVSVAPLFAGAIKEIHNHGSVSQIFRRACEEIFID